MVAAADPAMAAAADFAFVAKEAYPSLAAAFNADPTGRLKAAAAAMEAAAVRATCPALKGTIGLAQRMRCAAYKGPK
eukprot:967050-Prorocentrum_minimum.AAC.1